MNDTVTNVLIQTLPERGPGRTVMGLVIAVFGLVTAAAGYFAPNDPSIAGIVLLFGLLIGLFVFFTFKKQILDEQSFNATLPFELDQESAAAAHRELKRLRDDCAKLITRGRVRANIFRPSDEYQQYGCAVILKIDPRIAVDMSEPEIQSIRFLPDIGHTGRAFMRGQEDFGPPEVAITKEQLANLASELTYVMSFPISVKGAVFGVMNLDFCAPTSSVQDKKALTTEVETKSKTDEIVKLAHAALPSVSAALSKGRLQTVRLVRNR